MTLEWIPWEGYEPVDPIHKKLYREGKLFPDQQKQEIVKEKVVPKQSPENIKRKENKINEDTPLGRFWK